MDDAPLRSILRALIRVNYSEWDYNHHVGGDSLSKLLFGQNAIFDLNKDASQEEFESAIACVEEGWYPKDERQITLGGGYWDGTVLESVRWELDRRLYDIVARTFSENWYDVVPQLRPLVDEVLPDAMRELPARSTFYRARIGVEQRLVPQIPFMKKAYAYQPYAGSALGAPPLHAAGDGRLNRARVRVFYGATDNDTAVAELRPHPGHLVSVGQFKTNRALRIADLTTFDVRHFLGDTRLEVLRLIHSFERLLNVPVQPERKELYLITQLLADAFRVAGAEGLMFRSTLGAGINLAGFDVGAFAFVDQSATVAEIRSLHYTSLNATVVNTANVADWKEEQDNPLTTLYAGIAPKPR